MLEERLVLHPQGDRSRFSRCRLFSLQECEHLLVRAVLRDVVPRLRVDLGRLVDHVQRHRRGDGDQLLVLGHVHREVRRTRRPPGSRSSTRSSACGTAPDRRCTLRGGLAVEHRHRARGICSSTSSFCRDEVGLVTTTWQP